MKMLIMDPTFVGQNQKGTSASPFSTVWKATQAVTDALKNAKVLGIPFEQHIIEIVPTKYALFNDDGTLVWDVGNGAPRLALPGNYDLKHRAARSVDPGDAERDRHRAGTSGPGRVTVRIHLQLLRRFLVMAGVVILTG